MERIFVEIGDTVKARCGWCTSDPLYQRYHDEEWGVPTRDAQALFELLMLEGMQAGLSWLTVLRKRRHMREVFFEFAPERLVRMTTREIDARLRDPGIIRHRGKIEALKQNAKAYLASIEERPFAERLWSFVDDAPRQNRPRGLRDVPSHTQEAEAMSKALKRLGFTFVGPTICYAFMQAGGLVNDHVVGCFRRTQVGRAKRCVVA